MEVVIAWTAGLEVVCFVGDSKISPWLRYHSTEIVKTVEEAVEIINGFERTNE